MGWADLRKHLLLWILGVGGVVVSVAVILMLKDRLDELGRVNATQEVLQRLAAAVPMRKGGLGPTEEARRRELPRIALVAVSPEYVQNGRIYDAWNRELKVTFDRLGGVELRSAGPDGRFDTADDLVAAAR
ncbi:hypothetical protein LBMAG55_17750 [Verrucomicrobiota bacterium]|nr:hypothetical protein EMGBD4_07720 [Verrucomicrobiota bacterium]GDY18452.1 hypothetical protein LBMAG55_17750 [Verrucomicrobiota bacterium]